MSEVCEYFSDSLLEHKECEIDDDNCPFKYMMSRFRECQKRIQHEKRMSDLADE